MFEIVYYVAASADGFIAPADGSLEWLAPFEQSGNDYGYAAFYESIEALLLGGRTYEQVLQFGQWPHSDRPAWVFSRRSLPLHPGVTVTSDAPADVVSNLESQGVSRAWLVGGGELAGSFQMAGLITEYIVSVIPVLLGTGIGLLGGRGSFEQLELVTSASYPDGIVQNRYRRWAGD